MANEKHIKLNLESLENLGLTEEQLTAILQESEIHNKKILTNLRKGVSKTARKIRNRTTSRIERWFVSQMSQMLYHELPPSYTKPRSYTFDEVLVYFSNYHVALYNYHKSLELGFYVPDTLEEAMDLFYSTVVEYQEQISETTLLDVIEKRSNELFQLKQNYMEKFYSMAEWAEQTSKQMLESCENAEEKFAEPLADFKEHMECLTIFEEERHELYCRTVETFIDFLSVIDKDARAFHEKNKPELTSAHINKNITVEQLAKEVGIANNTVRNWLTRASNKKIEENKLTVGYIRLQNGKKHRIVQKTPPSYYNARELSKKEIGKNIHDILYNHFWINITLPKCAIVQKAVSPLFAYAGNKTQYQKEIIEELVKVLKENSYQHYCEPFAGALGSFLPVIGYFYFPYGLGETKTFFLNDANRNIMNIYWMVKEDPYSLLTEYLKIEQKFGDKIPDKAMDPSMDKTSSDNEFYGLMRKANAYYESVRKSYNNSTGYDCKRTAQLLFLASHCFRGMYNHNTAGEFATLFNYSPAILNISEYTQNFYRLSKLFRLARVQFSSVSYTDVGYHPNTLYYIDPPYLESNSEYEDSNAFTVNDQKKLIDYIKNVSFIYSNYDNPLIKQWLNEKLDVVDIRRIKRKNPQQNGTKEDKQFELLATHISKDAPLYKRYRDMFPYNFGNTTSTFSNPGDYLKERGGYEARHFYSTFGV